MEQASPLIEAGIAMTSPYLNPARFDLRGRQSAPPNVTLRRQSRPDVPPSDPDPNTSSSATSDRPPAAGSPNTSSRTKRILIDGRLVTIRSQPHLQSGYSATRLWDKEKRHQLPADVRQSFIKAATGFVLPKSNKLTVPSFKPDDDGSLAQIYNLQTQLKVLKSHLIDYDMVDVFNIVVPVDVTRTDELESETYDLFLDYPRLHEDIVACSNLWFYNWLHESYIGENMNLSFTLLRNNTDDSTWLKCFEDYNDYPPAQQGGPLMLFLILKRIQNVSETALEHLKTKLKNFKIRDLPGEDVDVAVSLVKSTFSALEAASTPEHTYIPSDFSCNVFMLFQTTTVPEFNKTFEVELAMIRRTADKVGGQPDWPSVTVITTLATNTYRRLVASGEWVAPAPAGTKVSGYLSVTEHAKRPTTTFQVVCWNCGGQHNARECKKPRDEAKIQAARDKFMAAKRARGGGNPKHKMGKGGKPLILNKKGAYVLDQKRWRAMLAKSDKSDKTSDKPADTKTDSPPETPASAPPPPVSPPPPPPGTQRALAGAAPTSEPPPPPGLTASPAAVRAAILGTVMQYLPE